MSLEDISTLGTKLNANNDTILNLDTELTLIKSKLASIEDGLEADLAILSSALSDPTKASFEEINNISENNIAVANELEELYAMINKEGGFASGLTTLSSELESVQQEFYDSVENATGDNTSLIVLTAIAVAQQAAK